MTANLVSVFLEAVGYICILQARALLASQIETYQL